LASKLKKSLEAHDLPHEIVQLDNDLEDWESVTCLKSRFILQMLLKHRDTVVWMDIDTEIWRFPKLLFMDHDFAIYNWMADKGHHLDGKIGYDPSSKILLCSGGVQKWRYTAASLHLLILWIEAIERSESKQGDDPFLDQAFNAGCLDINCLWLPKTYNRMDKHSCFWSAIPSSEVFINHDYTAGGHRIGDSR
jgi:hypothetical protein